jgi:antitoxin (DNA-binding transcriptional repressor) of toxin-antitoxin stability system
MTELEPQNRRLGYARVSTYGQTLDAQLDQLRKAGCTKIFREKVTGARADRRELLKLLKAVAPGDVVTVTRIDAATAEGSTVAASQRGGQPSRRWRKAPTWAWRRFRALLRSHSYAHTAAPQLLVRHTLKSAKTRMAASGGSSTAFGTSPSNRPPMKLPKIERLDK